MTTLNQAKARLHKKLADEAVEEQLSKLTDNAYLDRFSGGSRG